MSEGRGRCGSGCDGPAWPAARRCLHSVLLLLMPLVVHRLSVAHGPSKLAVVLT